MHLTRFLKNLAATLVDCDSNVDEIEIVMQILQQIPPCYHTIVDVITNTKPFPSFLEAKNMLLVYESREEFIGPWGGAYHPCPHP